MGGDKEVERGYIIHEQRTHEPTHAMIGSLTGYEYTQPHPGVINVVCGA